MTKKGRCRFIALAVVLSMVLSLAGCGAGTEPAPSQTGTPAQSAETPAEPAGGQTDTQPATTETIRFTMTDFGFRDAMENHFLPKYKEETGITVEFDFLGGTDVLDKALLEMNAGTNYYNGGYVSPMWKGTLSQHIVDLKPFMDKYGFDLNAYPADIHDEFFYTTFKPGEVWGVPLLVLTTVIAYRDDWFNHPEEKAAFQAQYGRELSPPETWQQLYEVAKFFTRSAGETVAGETLTESMYGYGFSWKPPMGAGRVWVNNFFHSAGFHGFDENFKPDINHPLMIEAVELASDIINDCLPEVSGTWDYMEHADYFAAGRMAMTEMYAQLLGMVEAPEAHSANNTSYITLPYYEGNLRGLKQGMPAISGGNISVFNTPLAEESYKFVHWLLNDNEYEYLTVPQSRNFSRIAHFEEPELLNDPIYQKFLPVFKKSLDVTFSRQPIPEYMTVSWNAGGDFLVNVVTGQLEPQAALDRWENTMIEEFTNAGYYD